MKTQYPEIPAATHADIMQRLAAAEREHDVRILLAIESGSRAWGFESVNSDFDVRFIYVHRKDWYLAVDLEDKRDVIEYPIVDEIDINGWDLRKALRLFSKSNPAFIEWLQSHIIYTEHVSFAGVARALLPDLYSCEKGMYHYCSMAKTNYREYLRGDLVPIKKYFYVLRPLLAVSWIEKYKTPPPIAFEKLLPLIAHDTVLLAEIHELLRKKRAAQEMGLSAQLPILNAYIEAELARHEANTPERTQQSISMQILNDLFRQCVGEF